jgi:hypothetical protein
MDESDLDNHVQRTADWLRRGINPNSNGTESEIAQGLDNLSRQLQQAEKGFGQGKPAQRGSDPSDAQEALDQVERLRGQIEAMAGSREGNGPPAQRNGQQQRNGTGQPGGDRLQRNNDSGSQNGNVHYGGGSASDGTVWGNINTGNNRYRQPGQHPAQADSSANPADTQRTYQQSLQALNHLRRMVQNDPQAAKEVEELVRQMQQLNPSRFPGNPAMVEQMHREVLSSVDKLELQLERDSSSTDARTGKSDAVPSGYQESVAEYYRRLSKNP